MLLILYLLLFLSLQEINRKETYSALNGTRKNETKNSDGFWILHSTDVVVKTTDAINKVNTNTNTYDTSSSTITAITTVPDTAKTTSFESLSEGDFITPDDALDLLDKQKALEITSFSVVGDKRKEQAILKNKTITCHDLTFTFNGDSFKINYPSSFNSKNVMDSVNKILSEMNSISLKGYVNTSDLRQLPVFLDFIPLFTIDDKYIKGKKVGESLKWINSLILIALYKILLERCDDPTGVNGDVTSSDTQVDLMELMSKIYKLLDPSLRRFIQKRGLTIIKNVYSGFDTEYKNLDEKFNDLISVQIATSTKIIIKLPLLSSYQLSVIDAKTNKIYLKKYRRLDDDNNDNQEPDEVNGVSLIEMEPCKPARQKSKKGFDFEKMEIILGGLGWDIRSLKYPAYDDSMLNLISGLNESGLSSMESGDSIYFSLPPTKIKPFIYLNSAKKGYNFADLIKQSNLLGDGPLAESMTELLKLLSSFYTKTQEQGQEHGLSKLSDAPLQLRNPLETPAEDDELTVLPVENLSELPLQISEVSFEPDADRIEKRLTRSVTTDFTGERLSVTVQRNLYLTAHLTRADISILNDFNEFKEKLSIVGGEFVTLGKGFEFDGCNVHLRDTMLLAPGNQKSLKAIGKLYNDNFNKKELTIQEISNMDKLLLLDRSKFLEYSKMDAIIPLIHCLSMEVYNWRVNSLGIPLTLSSLASRYVLKHWHDEGYSGYQISPDYLLGDASKTQTPLGLQATKQIGVKLPLYIASFKGGRNESFMYGVNTDTVWYDYDLISAYTTVLAGAGHPNYAASRALTSDELKVLTNDEILNSYTIIRCSFEFPATVKYPSIPCFLDEDASTTVYPLNGVAVLTGPEYILAVSQECKIFIHEAYRIPFKQEVNEKTKVVTYLDLPFCGVIKELQAKRRKCEKGTIGNALFKDMANSIYGNIVRGMGDKRKFDIKSGGMVRMNATELSNPIIASWVTGYVRSIIGETLHKLQNLKGKVVSVTTDGFITNIPELERELEGLYLMENFSKLRVILSGEKMVYELKNFGSGVISWSTRGQLGIESNIKAMTGFQLRGRSKDELVQEIIKIISSSGKKVEFMMESLTSSKNIYKHGGHVVQKSRDQIFRLHYDNRRRIMSEDEFLNSTEKTKYDLLDYSPIYSHPYSEVEGKTTPKNQQFVLLDSRPVSNVDESKNFRYLMKLSRNSAYNKETSASTPSKSNSYKGLQDKIVRCFLKGLLHTPPMFNLTYDFSSYTEVMNYLKEYDSSIKMTRGRISNLKNRNMLIKSVPRNAESLTFVDFVKKRYPNFDGESFLGK